MKIPPLNQGRKNTTIVQIAHIMPKMNPYGKISATMIKVDLDASVKNREEGEQREDVQIAQL